MKQERSPVPEPTDTEETFVSIGEAAKAVVDELAEKRRPKGDKPKVANG